MRFFLLVPLFFFFSCQPKIDIQKENYVFENNFEYYNSERYRLEETYYVFKEMSEDKSSGTDFLKKVNVLFFTVDSMRNNLENVIQEIEDFKISLFKKSGNNLRYDKLETKDRLAIHHFNFKDLRNNKASGFNNLSLSPSWQKMQASVVRLREVLCYYTANSSSTNEKFYFFLEPEIFDFSNLEKVNIKLDKASIETAPDDIEAIKQSYIKFSKGNPFIDLEYLQFIENKSVSDQINILTQVQTQLVSSTANLFRLIRSRFGGADYRFNKILTIVQGPEIVEKGDSVELKVCYSVYDSEDNPIVKVDRANSSQFLKDGITYIKFKASQKDEIIKGKITILNKSGVPKTMNWEKKIKVLK